MKPRHLEILQHALGLDQYGQGRGGTPRNHFCAGVDDEPDCRELVSAGLMVQHKRTEVFPDFDCSVTRAGRDAVRQHSPKPPVLTRSQHRYRKFLAHDSGMSFKEWLTRQSLEETGA